MVLELVRSKMPCVHDDERTGRSIATSCRSNQLEQHRSRELVLARSKVLVQEQRHSRELELVRSKKEHHCNGCAGGCADESAGQLAWFRHSRMELVRSKEPVLELARSRKLHRCNGCACLHGDERANQLAWFRRSTMERDRKQELVLVRSKQVLGCSNRSCD
ncbi:MAG: hypothetical protein KGQ51_10830 [Planctomycetes bacterium]|nr:hypothetical protein [Planctomycetota bacterium]